MVECGDVDQQPVAAAAATTGFASEQPGEQGGNGGFNPQDACAQLHRLQAGLGQQVDLVRDSATFRADGQGHGLVQPARAGRVIPGWPTRSSRQRRSCRQWQTRQPAPARPRRHLTSSTAHGATCSTRVATEPITRPTGLRPCVPMTIKSHASSSGHPGNHLGRLADMDMRSVKAPGRIELLAAPPADAAAPPRGSRAEHLPHLPGSGIIYVLTVADTFAPRRCDPRRARRRCWSPRIRVGCRSRSGSALRTPCDGLKIRT